MAKIQDKLFNRVIEGDLLELSDADKERAGIGGGGTQLYRHYIILTYGMYRCSLTLINSKSDAYTSISELVSDSKNYGVHFSVRGSASFEAPSVNGVLSTVEIDQNNVRVQSSGGVYTNCDGVSSDTVSQL